MRIDTKITNIVITTRVSKALILEDIAEIWKNQGCQYNKKRFPDLIFRLKIPKCTVLMFSSGKIVVEGCQYPSEGIYILRKIARMLRAEGYVHARCGPIIIQNVVGDAFLDFNVNLQKLGETLGEYCIIKSNFPGGIMKGLDLLLGTTVLIFWSGAILAAGGSSTQQIRTVIKNIEMLIIDKKCVMQPGETKMGILIAAGSRAFQNIPKTNGLTPVSKSKSKSKLNTKNILPLNNKLRRKKSRQENIIFE